MEYERANAVMPAGEVVNHARRVAERFNGLPPGAVCEAVLQTVRTEDAPCPRTAAMMLTRHEAAGRERP